MGIWTLLPLFLLAANVLGEGLLNSDYITERFSKIGVKYTSHHEIVNIILPLTRYNETICNKSPPPPTVFFVEADVNEGDVNYQGLYVLKNGTAIKILDNGRDATAFNIHSKKVYIGASDGIYIYDNTDGTTTKYGNLTDNIIRIETDELTGTVYFVTNDYKVFAVADEGRKKIEIKQLKDVKAMTIDLDGNYYYYDTKNDLYVYNDNGVKKFENIPRGNEIKLTKSMIAQKVKVSALVDNLYCILHSDGTFEEHKKITDIEKWTAYADVGFILYYASEKSMIEIDMIQAFCAQRNLLSYLALGDPNLRKLLSGNPYFS